MSLSCYASGYVRERGEGFKCYTKLLILRIMIHKDTYRENESKLVCSFTGEFETKCGRET
jgi:hypothetical protein